jgi:hypothetical protein
VVPMHGLGTRIDRETGKKTYKRVPGLHPHVSFLIESLFLKAERRPYHDNRPADPFKLQFSGLSMVRDLISRYYVASPPPKAILDALALTKTDATLAAPAATTNAAATTTGGGGFGGGLFGSIFGGRSTQQQQQSQQLATASASTNRALSARMPILAEFYSSTPSVGGSKTTSASSLVGTAGVDGTSSAGVGSSSAIIIPPPGHPLLDFIRDPPRIYVESTASTAFHAGGRGDDVAVTTSAVGGSGAGGSGYVVPPKSPGFEVMRRLLTSGDSLTSSLLSILEGSASSFAATSSFAGPAFNQLGASGSYSASSSSSSFNAQSLSSSLSSFQFDVNGVAESLELEASEREDSTGGSAILARAARVDAANRTVFMLTRIILEQSGQLQQLQQQKDAGAAGSNDLPALKPEQVTAEVAQAKAHAALVAGCGSEMDVADFHAPNGIRRQPLSEEQLQACARLAEAKSNDAIKETLGAGQGCGAGNDDPLPWKEKVVLCILSIIDTVLSKDNSFIAAVRELGFGGDRATGRVGRGTTGRNVDGASEALLVVSTSSSSSVAGAGSGSGSTSLLPFAQILKRRNIIPALAYLAGTTRRQEIGVLASRILYRLSIHHAGVLAPHDLVGQLMFPRLLDQGPSQSSASSSSATSNALIRAGGGGAGGLTFGQLLAANATGSSSSSSSSNKAANAAREAALEKERDNDRKSRVETAFAQSLRQRHTIIQRLVAALGDDEGSEDNDETEEIMAARQRRVLVEMSASAAGIQLSPSVLAAAAAVSAGYGGAGGRGSAETGGGSSVEDVLAMAAGYYQPPQSAAQQGSGGDDENGIFAGVFDDQQQQAQDNAFFFAAAAQQGQNTQNPQAAGAAALLGAAMLEFPQAAGRNAGGFVGEDPESYYLAAPAVNAAQADARATRLLDDGVRALLNPSDAILAALQPPMLIGALGAADYSLLVGSSPSAVPQAAFLSAGIATDPRFRIETAHTPLRLGIEDMPFSTKHSIEGALKNVNGSSVSWGLDSYLNRKAFIARRAILLELILRSVRMATAEAARAGVLFAAASGRNNARKAVQAAQALAQQRKDEAAAAAAAGTTAQQAQPQQQDERLQLALGFGAGGSKATSALTAAALPKRGMTIAHLLLGIPSGLVSFSGSTSGSISSGGGVGGAAISIPFDVVSCFHAIVALAASDSQLPIVFGSDDASIVSTMAVAATSVDGALTSPDFTTRRPRVAETATRLLSSLLEDPRTRAPTLDFLQTSNYYTGNGDRRRFFLSRLLNVSALLPEAVCPPAPLPITGGDAFLPQMQQTRLQQPHAEDAINAGAINAENTMAMSAIEAIVTDDAMKRGLAGVLGVPGAVNAGVAGAGVGASDQEKNQQQMVPLFTRQSVSYRHLLSDHLESFSTDIYCLLSGNVVPAAFSSSNGLPGATSASSKAAGGGVGAFGLPRVETLREVLAGLQLNLPEDLLLDTASASSSLSAGSLLGGLAGASLDAQAAAAEKVAQTAALRSLHRQRVKCSVLLRLLKALPLRDARPGPRPALLESVLSLIDVNEGLSAALGSAIPLSQLMQPLGLGSENAGATGAFASALGAGAAAAAFGSVALPSRYSSVQTPLGPRVSLGSTPLQWYQCYDLQVIRSLLHLATARSSGSVLRPLLNQVKNTAATSTASSGIFGSSFGGTNTLSAAIGLANETVRSANLTGTMLRTNPTLGAGAGGEEQEDSFAGAANAAARSMLLSALGQAHTRTLLSTLAGAADRGAAATGLGGGAGAVPDGQVDPAAEIAACLRWVIASNTYALQLQAAHRLVSSWCNAVLAVVYSCVPDPDPSTHGDLVLGLPAQLALRDTLFAFASGILSQITEGLSQCQETREERRAMVVLQPRAGLVAGLFLSLPILRWTTPPRCCCSLLLTSLSTCFC